MRKAKNIIKNNRRTSGAKAFSQEGNSPDYFIRSLICL